MQSVTVLTPHGRRHVVKVEANTTILKILEVTCEKFNFDPDMYDLKTQHKKSLDLSLMFRFSGIPNNSNLEMVECLKKRCDSLITICIQTEDGTRASSPFSSSTSLQEIISKLCPDKDSSDKNPIVIYMRKEVYGESLSTTTLKSLGLSSGSALLRLVNADPESLKTQANVSAPLARKPKTSEEEEENSQRSAQIAHNSASASASASSSSSTPTIETFQAPINVEIADDNDVIEVPLEVKKEIIVKEEIINLVNGDVQEIPMEINVDDIKEEVAKPTEAVIIKLDDRGTIIFSLDSFDNSTSKTELPDSFFDLTETDVRHLYRELKSQVDNYESSPLLTKQLRQLEESKKILNQLSLYKMCSLRIKFPNRLVIQTRFATITKIEEVKEFVRSFLVDPTMEFDLYVTPPKTILEPELTLIEAQLVPSALIHIGCELQDNKYIKAEYFEKLSSGFAALSILNIAEEEDNAAGPSTSQEASGSGSLSNKKPVPNNFLPSSASAAEASGKLPKWFKKTGY